MFCLLGNLKSSLLIVLLWFVDVNFCYEVVNENGTLNRSENVSCHGSDDSEFPEDLFTELEREHGAIILHVILAVYCFAAIATVCTEYFLPTIKCICEDLKLSDDVAAATFMSIATSSPELFTTIIGTFITESDIGIGHVLGNAYYDMFFVAAVGGLAATGEIILDWWPITRDCFVYLFVSITLTAVVWDGEIETYETIILLALYVIYFIIMFNNRRIIAFLKARFNIEINDPVEETSLPRTNRRERTNTNESEKGRMAREDREAEEPLGGIIINTVSSNPQLNDIPSKSSKCLNFWTTARRWAVKPLRILISCTMFDVRKSKWRNYYPLVFIICVAWIGVSTYLGCWMIHTIGQTIGVPDVIMGMIFMAAGGSVVEVYAVFFKARRGECSIGLSNSMGCNTIDATMCLALPWLVKTLIPVTATLCNNGSSDVALESSVLHINCILLVASVLLLFTILCFNKFKLNKTLGVISGIIYAVILTIAITVETYGITL